MTTLEGDGLTEEFIERVRRGDDRALSELRQARGVSGLNGDELEAWKIPEPADPWRSAFQAARQGVAVRPMSHMERRGRIADILTAALNRKRAAEGNWRG
jgi:hypothetical protein